MRERFRQFMFGRYGSDGLNRFLSMVSLGFMVLAFVTHFSIFYWLGLLLLIYAYTRMFSRNIAKRSQENAVFYRIEYQAKEKWRQTSTRFSQRRFYHYYRCPRCRQQLRVPRGRGKIMITCPKCHTEFTKKS